MAKMIVALIAESLESMHDLNIIHAGMSGSDCIAIKPTEFSYLELDNVLFAVPYPQEDIVYCSKTDRLS